MRIRIFPAKIVIYRIISKNKSYDLFIYDPVSKFRNQYLKNHKIFFANIKSQHVHFTIPFKKSSVFN